MDKESKKDEGEKSKDNLSPDTATPGGILRIADELVRQIDRTKKFILMTIVVIIIGIPVAWHASPILLGSPSNFELVGVFTIIVALIFLVIGVRQWLLFSKWTKRFRAYKELQKRIDTKLDFEDESGKDQ